jgi:hypothetical protein
MRGIVGKKGDKKNCEKKITNEVNNGENGTFGSGDVTDCLIITKAYKEISHAYSECIILTYTFILLS